MAATRLPALFPVTRLPACPATLESDVHESFEGLRGAEHTAEFMTITSDCTEKFKRECGAAVHVDGTARPQIVREATNPSMHKILTEYKKRTGVGTTVNTSFNMHEEPIVCSPADAVRAFSEGKLGVLALGPFVAWIPANGKPRVLGGESEGMKKVSPRASTRPSSDKVRASV